MNRRSLIALASIISLTAWHKPIINSIVLPAHAQTSCSSVQDVDIIGNWLFTDADGNTVEIEFIEEGSLRIDNRQIVNDWDRSSSTSELFLEVRNPRAPWVGTITQEDNCLASEITLTDARSEDDEFTKGPFTVPLIGVRN